MSVDELRNRVDIDKWRLSKLSRRRQEEGKIGMKIKMIQSVSLKISTKWEQVLILEITSREQFVTSQQENAFKKNLQNEVHCMTSK